MRKGPDAPDALMRDGVVFGARRPHVYRMAKKTLRDRADDEIELFFGATEDGWLALLKEGAGILIILGVIGAVSLVGWLAGLVLP